MVFSGKNLSRIIAAAFSLAAFWGVLQLTDPPGPGLDPDAMSYLGAGASLAHGHGLRIPSAGWASADTTSPLAHFPPGFSLAIAAGVAAGAGPVNAARFIEAAAAAVTVAVIVLTAASTAGPIAGLAAGIILAVTPAIVIVHASVLSEPLFLALMALFLWRSAQPRGTDAATHTRRALILGVIAAAAAMVRYAGLAFVAAAVLDALLAPRIEGEHPLARLRRAAMAGMIPVLTLALWTVSQSKPAEGATIRETGFYVHGIGGTLAEGANTFARWLAPGVEPAAARWIAAALVFVAIVALVKFAARAAAPAMQFFLRAATLAFCYAAVVGASRLVADADIPLDDRMVAPLFLLLAPTIGVALTTFWRVRRANEIIVLTTVGFALSWVWGATDVSANWARIYRDDGGDFAAAEWRDSPALAWVASAPAGTPLYTNWPAAIWFHTGRGSRLLPAELDDKTVNEFRAKIAREGGVVIAFRAASPDVAEPEWLAQQAGLQLVTAWPDAKLWRAPSTVGTIRP